MHITDLNIHEVAVQPILPLTLPLLLSVDLGMRPG